MRISLLAFVVLLGACGGSPTTPSVIRPQVNIALGQSQVDTVGRTLPIQIGARLINATTGAPLPQYILNWSAVDGGQLFANVTETGPDGIARNAITLGNHSGIQRFTARYIDPTTGEAVTLDTVFSRALPERALWIRPIWYPIGYTIHVGDTVAIPVLYEDRFSNNGAACPDGVSWESLVWQFDTTVVRFARQEVIPEGVVARFVGLRPPAGTLYTVTLFTVTTGCQLGGRTVSVDHPLVVQ